MFLTWLTTAANTSSYPGTKIKIMKHLTYFTLRTYTITKSQTVLHTSVIIILFSFPFLDLYLQNIAVRLTIQTRQAGYVMTAFIYGNVRNWQLFLYYKLLDHCTIANYWRTVHIGDRFWHWFVRLDIRPHGNDVRIKLSMRDNSWGIWRKKSCEW
jgi:hypothetical protein